MTARRLAGMIVVGTSLTLSCDRPEPAREEANAALGGEIAAMVGAEAIPLSLVASVAVAQNVTPQEAVRRIVDDEIAAAAARARGLDRQAPASFRLVAARARLVTDRLFEEAKRRGPPTDEEVAELTEKHWQEVDRPPAVRVIHAIALRPKDEKLVEAARRVAEELHRAVVNAADAAEFEKKAKEVPHAPEIEVRVERLPAFTDDGWVTEGPGAMDETFARAAHDVPSIGGTSPVVETRFGFHVIRLLERIPEQRMPLETRRVVFAEEVYSMRARALLDTLLKPLREAKSVEVSPAAEELMRGVTTKLTGAQPYAESASGGP